MPVNPHIKGGPDVPVTDGGTGASSASTGLSNLGGIDTSAHSSIDHTGIPGVGDLTTAAHSSLDHTGIPGAGASLIGQESGTPSSSGGTTAEETLSSVSVPANTLASNGDSLRASFRVQAGTHLSGASATTRIRWGGSQIYSKAASPGANLLLNIDVRIKRTGVGTQVIYVDDGTVTRMTGSADETSGNSIAISNQNSSGSNDAGGLVVDLFEVEAVI